MAFGQELKDFADGFKTGYSASSDRRDKKEERRRNAINDPIDNEYKQSVTESNKLKNKWYDVLAEDGLKDSESTRRYRDKTTEWYDSEQESLQDARRSQIDYQRASAWKLLNPDADEEAPELLEDTDAVPPSRFDVPESAIPVQKTSSRSNNGEQYEVAKALYATASDLGVSPMDLAGVIDYETIGKWNPDIRGGKNNDYVGLIQFGPQERAQYGYKPGMSIAEQIQGPVKNYLQDRGLKPGHGIDEMYGIINAGSLKNGRPRYGAHDGNGTVADHIGRIKKRNIPRAQRMFGAYLVPEQQAATGGLIEPVSALRLDEEEEAAPPVQMAQALPTEGPIPEERPAVTPEGNDDPAKRADPRVAGFDKAHEAVMEGIKYSLQEMGLAEGAAVQDPDRAGRMAAYLKGQGAAAPSIIKQAYAAVDPDNELSESERTMAALARVHEHYMKQGEPEKAQKAAASIVQYQRVLFQRYSAIAQAAMSEGDIDGGVTAAVRAYASVPDGRDIKVSKREDGRYAVEFTDEATGEVISNPVLSPQEIGAFAMQVSPASFDEFILGAAGQKAEKTTGPSQQFQAIVTGMDEGVMPSNKDMAALDLEEQKEIRIRMKEAQAAGGEGEGGGGEDVTFTQRNEIRTEVMPRVFEEMAAMPDPDNPDKAYYGGLAELPALDKRVYINAATDIMTDARNNTAEGNVSEIDAIELADTIAYAGPQSYKKQEEKNGVLVTLPDERQMFVPTKHFNQLDNLFKRRMEAERKAEADNKKKIKTDASMDRAAAGDRITDRNNAVSDRRNSAVPTQPWVDPLGSKPVPPGRDTGDAWSLPMGATVLPPEVKQRALDTNTQSTIDRLQELLGW